MRKKIIAIIITVAVVSGLVYMRTEAKKKADVASVKTASVMKGEVKSYLSTTGTIKSKNSKDYFGNGLKVKNVNVKVGDSVNKGAVLISYDTDDLNTSVKQAQIQYNNAVLQKQDTLNQKNDLDKKISDLDSQISNLESSKNPADQATLQQLKTQRSSVQTISSEKLKQLDNSIALAKATLDSANSKLSTAQSGVIADFDGVVTVLNASVGATATPGQAIAVIQDLNSLKAVVSLGKYDALKVKIGQEAEIKSGDKVYKGKVSFINPAASKTISTTGGDTTLITEIDILDKTENLKVDFDTDINILLGDVKDVLKIPAESIKTDKTGKTVVYVDLNGIAKEQEVKLGLQSDVDVQVLEGIKDGEKVVLNPTATIKDGSKVKETVEGAK